VSGGLVALLGLACFGCDALWGISSLDVQDGDGGDTDASAPPPDEDATAPSGDARPRADADANADADADATGDALVGDSAPPADGAPAADYCTMHQSDQDLVLCDDFDSYDGSMAALYDGGTWNPHPYMGGPPGTLDLSTYAAAGADSAWALHEVNPDAGASFSQFYIFAYTTNPTFIEVQLDLLVSSVPINGDYIDFVGVAFEHGGAPMVYDTAVTVIDGGFGIGEDTQPDQIPSNTVLMPMTWTHVDWTLTLSQAPPYTLSTSLVIGGTTAIPVTDASNDDGYGPATIQVGLTYEPSTPTAHDVYIDNVLVTAHQ
jgi:hypothetical protein